MGKSNWRQYELVAIVFLLFTIKLYPPVADCSFGPAYDFDTNVLATLAFDMSKDAFLFLINFSDSVRAFENTGRWYPAFANQVLARTYWANEHFIFNKSIYYKLAKKERVKKIRRLFSLKLS